MKRSDWYYPQKYVTNLIKLQTGHTSVTAVEPPCSRPTMSNGQYQKLNIGAYHIRFDFSSLAALKQASCTFDYKNYRISISTRPTLVI
jgi:hypothetical protein